MILNHPIDSPDLGRKVRSFFIALTSAVVPGMGQLLNKAYRAAMFWFGLIVAVWLASGLFKFWSKPAGLVGTVCVAIALYFSSALHAGSKQRLGWWWVAALVAPALLLAAVLATKSTGLVWRLSGFRTFSVSSQSMEPVIMPNDIFVADMSYYKHRHPADGDPVVFFDESVFKIKRIEALPGETVEGRGGVVLRNGLVLRESYAVHTQQDPMPELQDFGPVKVPEDRCFLLGDNRDVSYDSRTAAFGLKPLSVIVGRPLYVVGNPVDPSRYLLNVH